MSAFENGPGLGSDPTLDEPTPDAPPEWGFLVLDVAVWKRRWFERFQALLDRAPGF